MLNEEDPLVGVARKASISQILMRNGEIISAYHTGSDDVEGDDIVNDIHCLRQHKFSGLQIAKILAVNQKTVDSVPIVFW